MTKAQDRPVAATRVATQPIPAHLVDRFFTLAWSMSEGYWPADNGVGTRRPLYLERHALASLWGVSAALRFSELAGLRVADVSAAGWTAWIQRSKRGVHGLVQVSPRLVAATMDWRSQQDYAKSSPWLFPNRDGGRLDNNAYNLSIGRMFGGLLGVRLSSHSFRDTACHLAVAQGATVYEVQRFLGHKTAITTEHYLRKVQAQGLRLHALDREYMGVVA